LIDAFTPTNETITMFLHDALPIWNLHTGNYGIESLGVCFARTARVSVNGIIRNTIASATKVTTEKIGGLAVLNQLAQLRTKTLRSEEHTSELQTRVDLVWRLLFEK